MDPTRAATAPPPREEGHMYTSVERDFLPRVDRSMDYERIRCMAVLRVWRNRPSDGNVQLMIRDTDSTRMICLNPTGSYIWRLADAHPTLEELIQRFAEEYELPRQQAEDDVLTFVNFMIEDEHIRAVEVE